METNFWTQYNISDFICRGGLQGRVCLVNVKHYLTLLYGGNNVVRENLTKSGLNPEAVASLLSDEKAKERFTKISEYENLIKEAKLQLEDEKLTQEDKDKLSNKISELQASTEALSAEILTNNPEILKKLLEGSGISFDEQKENQLLELEINIVKSFLKSKKIDDDKVENILYEYTSADFETLLEGIVMEKENVLQEKYANFFTHTPSLKS